MPKISPTILLIIFLSTAGAQWLYTTHRGRIRGDYERHYLAARAIVHKHNIYDIDVVRKQFKYPPFNALLLAPLSFFNIYISQSIWFGLCVVMFLGVFRMTGQMLGGERHFPWWVWSLPILLMARFFWMNLKLGQINSLMFFATVLGLYVVENRKKPFIGGGILGMAAVLKYMPAFFILYYVIKRRWRECAGMALGIVLCLFIIPAIFLGPSYTARLLKEFAKQGTRRTAQMVGGATVAGQSLHTLTFALLTPIDMSSKFTKRYSRRAAEPFYINVADLGRKKAKTIARLFCLIVLILTGWILLPRKRATYRLPAPPRFMWEYGLIFVAFLIISPEARKAQFLTLYIPTAAAFMGYYVLRERHSVKAKWFLITVILSQILFAGTAGYVVGKSLERWFDAYCAMGWGALVLGLLMVYALRIKLEARNRHRQ